MDIIDPAIDSIKRLLNLKKAKDSFEDRSEDEQSGGVSIDPVNGNITGSGSGFDLDEFIRQKLSLDPSKLEVQLGPSHSKSTKSAASVWRSENKNVTAAPKL